MMRRPARPETQAMRIPVRLMYCLVLVYFLGFSVSHAAASCKLLDLMPQYWQSIDKSDAAARIRAAVIEPHPDLYNENYVDLPTGDKWQATIAQEQAYAQAHRKEIAAADRYLSTNAQHFMKQFADTFADFKCDFTFYIAPSFGRMDGSAAFVNGEHRIIFAPDVIPRYHKLSELKVLIDHETFHIYHHQATGRFGASPEPVTTILEALWSEGLATFVSWRMNPAVSLDAALLQPGIPEGAKPHLADIAKDLLAHLDTKDRPTYFRYFAAGKQPEGYPPRAGYYVGTLIAQDLSARYSLTQLAHLDGPELRASLVSELQKFAAPAKP
jgi:hypothetical protein